MAHEPESISRTFARWSVGLTYDDLPPAVVDKVKALTLMALVAGLIGADDHHAKALVDLLAREEAKPDGATVLRHGTKVTRTAAVTANCEILHIAGLYDSYRMLTHPGPVLVGTALTNAELGGNTGREFITALAAGYETECRVAHDFIPAIAAQGFRPSPFMSAIGGAMVAAKLMGLDEDAVVTTLAVAANLGSGLNEGARAGGGEMSVQEANAAKQGTFAALMASLGTFSGSEQIFEGPAGFYRAFAGRSESTVSHVFTGPREIDLATLTDGLGSTYKLLDVMFRMYPTAGYNQPVIDAIAELRDEHAIDPGEIEEIVVSMNYLETTYPSPEFPKYPDWWVPRPGTTYYFAAYSAVHGGYPAVGMARPAGLADDPAVEEMMRRVTLRPVYGHPMFSPNVLIRTKDGRAYGADYPYSRMSWNLDRLGAELHRCVDGIPGGAARLAEAESAVRALETLDSVVPLFAVLSA